MAEEKLLVEYETEHGPVKLSPNIIRRYLVNGQGNVTDEEVVMFINLCRYQQLNPFLKEAYLIKYSNSDPATMVVGKDTFLKRAGRDPQYDGSKAGIYVQRDKSVEKRVGTLVLPNEKLVGGWAEIYRKNWQHPIEISVSFQEYEGKKKDGTTTRQWSRMPATMIRKVALVQALREAFPEQFQGMYDAAEMGGTEIVEGESINYQIYPERQDFGSVPSEKSPEPEKEPQKKTEEYKKIEKQILKDIKDPAFVGIVEMDGEDRDLDYYREEIPKKLAKKVHSIQALQESADTVARLLQAAYDRNKKVDEEIGDDDRLFPLDTEHEGNLDKGVK
jgi:phage recombination protein Bet